uniref:AlNc14C94G5794 protein n=1 Tax=Albugo laibachii Nc14 TaxID=890382 RepID=F0WGR7_9STRA|nr:AlNc14C94G5794 [Albugo laibachii Nc14]|eukprot:CCA20431.1 AlNc14C94G5794 [Albugo laibachii Nc14]
MESLTSSNEELREAYREKARKCRNWEKMFKALKAQHTTRGAPSPTSSSASMNQSMRPESNAFGTLPAQFAHSISRPLSYTSEKSPGMLLRPQVASLRRPETPNAVRQRPNRPILERFSRSNSAYQQPHSVPSSRPHVIRPKTPIQLTQRSAFVQKRPIF